MKRTARFSRLIPVFLTTALICGCSSWQLQEAGKSLATSAAEQLLILGISGKDGLQDYNDYKERKWRSENNPDRPSLTRDELIESYQRAEQWEFYDSILSKQEDYIRRKLPDAPSGDPLASSNLSVQNFGCY